ncbi:MAG: VWA domain-containing protein [Pyrinomonadaceae bacterium]|nr:VWA domain-containing protein [Pyrinomonadaceae bacterium]
MADASRRLPVYLLLDCSESMAGPAIEAVTQGVKTLIDELRSNPLALETAYLSVITFSRVARQTVPLTELMLFNPPQLSVRPGTALGAALRLLVECIQREVVKTTQTTKGDYKPLVFLLTDGQPTDDWEEAADAIRLANNPKVANLYAIGCGPDVEIQVLYRITDKVLLMPDLTPEAIRKCFVWLSASVQAMSVSVTVDASPDNPLSTMPALPLDAMQVALEQEGYSTGAPRQVFLHARCSNNRQPYLMRYVRREYEDRYDAVASHRLETLDESDAEAMPPINTSLLSGVPGCPYCVNRNIGVCPCGGLFCSPDNIESIMCPKCDAYLGPGTGSEDFEINPSQG